MRIITKRRQENLKIGGGTWFRAYLMPLGLVISCVALQRLAVASFTTIAQNCDKRFPSAHANKHGVTRNPGRCICFSYLSGQVFQNSGAVDGGGGSDTAMASGAVLQVSMNSAHGKL